MTNPGAVPPPSEPVEVRERRTSTDRVKGRTCAWCEAWIPYLGSGRVPKYCTQSCRQRAYELRTAEARRDRDAAAGLLREEPVRELVERTETVTRTVVRQGLPWENGTALRAPHTTAEWCQMLAHLAKRIPDMRFNNDPDRPELDAAIRHLHAVLEANPAINLPPRQAPPQLSEANDYALQEPVKVRPAQSDAAEAKPEAAPVTPSRGTENRH